MFLSFVVNKDEYIINGQPFSSKLWNGGSSILLVM